MRLQVWRDAPPGFSFPASLKEEGLADIPCGAVQQFFLRAEDGPRTASRLSPLDPLDVVTRFSHQLAGAGVFPAVDVVTSCSCLFQTTAASAEHVAVAERVRQDIAVLWAADPRIGHGADALMLERAPKLQNYFTPAVFRCRALE
jgi:F0F1-type ATP synthase beta subunit